MYTQLLFRALEAVGCRVSSQVLEGLGRNRLITSERGAGSEGEARVHGLDLRGLLWFRVAGYEVKGLGFPPPSPSRKPLIAPEKVAERQMSLSRLNPS